jgi:micrococcal nuclease
MKISMFVCLVFLSLNVFADYSGVVLSIHDGDTITILEKGAPKKTKVRLLGVDTPEVDFNGRTQGEMAFKARDYLRSLIPLNSEIIVKPQEKSLDSNGRTLGQIYYQGQDINYLMLKAGWGALYFIYPFDKKVVSDYVEISGEAISNKRGIFSDLYLNEDLAYMFRINVKGVEGNNLFGDFLTKVLKHNIEEIPSNRRVFFPTESIALSQGYRWK